MNCLSEEGSLAVINVDIVVDIVHKNQDDELRVMRNKQAIQQQGEASRCVSARRLMSDCYVCCCRSKSIGANARSPSLAIVIGDDDDQQLRTFEERRK